MLCIQSAALVIGIWLLGPSAVLGADDSGTCAVGDEPGCVMSPQTHASVLLQTKMSVTNTALATDDLVSSPAPTQGQNDFYLSELTLLAGAAADDVTLTPAAMEELGWTPGVLVADTTHQNLGMLDHARTYSKNGECIATFGATNDAMDRQQVIGGFAVDPVNFCGFQVHAGIVDEMAGFMRAPKWSDFITYLNSPNCTSVTAVGHSLGGALATLFAGCANVGATNGTFGARTDYRLVAYAPIGISMEPIYSGTPGTPFLGMRYGITESDGGVSSKAALPQNTKQMRLDILKFYVGLTTAMNHTAAPQLSQAYQQFKTLPARHIEPAWDQLEPSLVPFLLPTFQIGSAPPPGMEAFQPMVQQMVMGLANRGELSFSFDPVSDLSSPFGYKHALVDFQPIANPLKDESDSSYTKVFASQAAELPNHDSFQAFFAIMAEGGGFPNHNICCYSSASGCQSKFNQNWLGCRYTSFR